MSEARLRDAQLLVTELVANAVRHGGAADTPISIEVRASDEAMRVAVTDDGTGFDPHAVDPPSMDRGGGLGLKIVAALAHRWGVDRSSRTTVWFEIDRPRGQAPLAVEPIPASDDRGE